MKGGTLQITWHGSDPVLTLDFHSLSGLLATGGADHDIKFWTLHEARDGPLPSATFHSSLSYHTAAVNVVRFSVAGDQLASGADGGEILLWKLTENSEASNMWKLAKNLRFHVKDVLDLQWSLDGVSLISGSVDNTVIIWDIAKGNPQQVLKDHMHYVQGVAWDPIGQYIASISGDRTCRIYTSKPQNSKSKSQDRPNFSCQSVLVKAELPKQEDDATKDPPTKLNLFHDETLPSFFRRLAWSPEGSFLLVPAGIHKFPSETVLTNTAFIISRKDLSRPAVQLPGASKPVVAVRFCPVLFTCYSNIEQKTEKDSNDTGVFKLPYRLVFAVATLNSLYVYDTQSRHPLALLAGIHYAAITDIAWSTDGKFLAVSSQDGFCTLVMFDREELGSPLLSSEVPAYVAKLLSPPKDKVGEFHSKVPEAVTKGKSKGDSISEKKADNLSSSALGMEKQAQLNGEEQAEVGKVPEEQSKISVACPEPQKERNMSNGDSYSEIQHADHKLESANKENAMVFKRDESNDAPKTLKRITPIAISHSSSHPLNGATSSLTNLSTPSQLCQEVKETSEISPKKPRRITPVAILSAAQCNPSAANSGAPLNSIEEAKASPALVMQASPTQVKFSEESNAGCIDVANCSGHVEPDNSSSKGLQTSPKRPRRITPQPIDVNSDGLQITEPSSNDMK
ncbi:hypothetical protein GOP47_0007250 [Adiantum capillus-veneris]|uniref:CAF-1 p60 homolog n=1 Tax=Adiantum capillus-veneris TaxID=13818 RepID=A0A9D4ZLC4_ADICA|nr:hypothetical protein GOP47_0007250 [Adiantum capillus-veneris]